LESEVVVIENGLSPLKDEFVVYYSQEDNSWVAHSLHTDQIGLGGDSVVDAIVDLLVGLHNLFEFIKYSKEYFNIAVEAPPEIFLIREKAKLLPDSVYQLVIEKLFHRIPSSWGVQVNIPQSEKVTVSMDLPLQECPL
jgi:hypothetical protein